MTFDEFLETLIQKKSSDIRVGYICKIESVDYKKLTASISPLWKFAGEDGNKKYGVLTDVPISFLGGNSAVRFVFIGACISFSRRVQAVANE